MRLLPPNLRQRLRSAIATLGGRLGVDMRYLVSGSVWLNGRIAISMLLTFALSVLFANTLSPEAYGNYRFILSAVTFWGALLLNGANTAVAGAVARGFRGSFRASIPQQALWDIAAAIGIAGTGLFFLLKGNTVLGVPILLSAITYPLSAIFNTYSSFFNGARDFRRQAIFESLTVAVYVLSIAIGLAAGASAELLAVIFFASNALGHGIGFIRAWRLSHKSDPEEKSAAQYARQLSLVSIPSTLMLQLDNILVFHYLGSVDLAIYTFAMLGPDKLGSLMRFVPQLTLPKYARREQSELRSSIPRRALQFSIFGIVVALLYAIAAPTLFHYLYPQYAASIPYTRLYAITLITVGGLLPLSSLLARARIRRIAVIQFVPPAIQLILTFVGIRYGGLLGAILAKLAGDFLSYALVFTVHQYQQTEPLIPEEPDLRAPTA